MELYIGGYAQNKLNYVLSAYRDAVLTVRDGGSEDFEAAEPADIYNHLHLWVKRKLEEEKEPESLIEDILADNPNCIIISDEIGNGIVPIEASEREYRERTGRMLCELASKAERVERIICGIGQRIK